MKRTLLALLLSLFLLGVTAEPAGGVEPPMRSVAAI